MTTTVGFQTDNHYSSSFSSSSDPIIKIESSQVSGPIQPPEFICSWEIARTTFKTKLDCPFQLKFPPYWDDIQKETCHWLHEKGLISDKGIEKFNGSQFAYFIALTYPNSSSRILRLISDWASIIFLYDDRSEKIFSSDISKLREFNQCNMCVLEGTYLPTQEGDPISLALCDLIIRTKILINPERSYENSINRNWMGRFIQNFKDHFESIEWETLKSKTVPSLETYFIKRPYTGACYIMFDLIEISEGINLPNEIFNDAHFQEIRLACNNIICWSNDIISLPKESPEEGNNLIYVLQAKNQCSLDLAYDMAVEYHNSEVKKFQNLRDSLPSFGLYDGAVRKYVDGLATWMKGHYEWSLATDRYKKPVTDQRWIKA